MEGGLRVEGSGFRVQAFRVQGLDLRFRVVDARASTDMPTLFRVKHPCFAVQA